MEKIGWIGTGVMGRSMAFHLLEEGYSLHLYNRTKEKAQALLDRGAQFHESPAVLAQQVEVLFTMVGYPQDVEEVLLGPKGALEGLPRGGLLIDMTTSEPSLAQRLAKAGLARGVEVLDAPVSGGDLGAREKTLAIMCGGTQTAFERALPLLRHLGKNIRLMGGPGAGQHTKMCNQILIATGMIGVVESLLYAHQAGLDREEVIEVIGSGAAASWSINNLGRRIAAGDFAPGFYIKHFVKDMGIALKEAAAMKLSLPGLALVHQFYTAALAQGLENLGTQGLYKVFEAMNSKGTPA